MASPSTTAAPADERAAPNSDAAEHIFIGSDDVDRNPATAARTVSAQLELRDRVRRTRTSIGLFAEGFLEVAEQRGGRSSRYRLDLQYVDPVPVFGHKIASRTLWTALALAAFTAAAAGVAALGVVRAAAVLAALAGAVGCLATIGLAVYRSYEKIEFRTIHGRAAVITLTASVGSIRAARALVRQVAHAVEESADTISADTSGYLRAEMREHYRLRDEGVLDAESCAESTGRILAQFDLRL